MGSGAAPASILPAKSSLIRKLVNEEELRSYTIALSPPRFHLVKHLANDACLPRAGIPYDQKMLVLCIPGIRRGSFESSVVMLMPFPALVNCSAFTRTGPLRRYRGIHSESL
jgi:hypothetical protein